MIGGGHVEVPKQAPCRFASVRWAKDGDGLICLTDAGGRDFMALCRLDPKTGGVTPIYEPEGRDVEAWSLSPDGTLLATIENDRGYAILRIGAPGEQGAAVNDLPRGVVGDLSWSAESDKLAFALSTPTRPSGLLVWEKATGTAAPGLAGRPDGGCRHPAGRASAISRWWNGRASTAGASRAGSRFPRGHRPAKGWPAVIWVHGGPASQTRANFRADMQVLLAQGYAVLMPNVRGSTGYGRAWMLSDEREKRLDTVNDLAHGRHWLAKHPEIDAERIAVMGQSYGGYMVNAAITEYPGLWKAAIDFYGIADFVTLLRDTGAWRRSHRADEYGFPDQHAELFRRISPIHNIDRAIAPLLVAARGPRSARADGRERADGEGVRGAAEKGPLRAVRLCRPRFRPPGPQGPRLRRGGRIPVATSLKAEGAMREAIRSHRPLIMGRHGAVGSNHPLATQAGLDMLRAGGNAVGRGGRDLADARRGRADDVGARRRRVLPRPSRRQRRRLRAITAPAPRRWPRRPSVFARRHRGARAAFSVSMPGLLAGIAAMQPRTASLPWAKLFGAAIEHARDGFAATHHYRHFAGECRAILAADRALPRESFCRQAEVPPLAALIRQPDLARTLEEIASDGAETLLSRRAGEAPGAPALRGCGRAGRRTRPRATSTPSVQEPIAIALSRLPRSRRRRRTPPASPCCRC